MVAFTNFAIAALAGYAAAHPGEKHDAHKMKRELVARDNAAQLGARSLASCSNSASSQALKARSIKRRANAVKNIRQKRGIKAPARKDKRTLEDLQKWEAVNHNMSGTYNYDMFTSIEEVFSGNTSCILAPEITNGPYYVVGEKMRSNVKEALYCDGIDLFLEVQYIDTNTCEPIPAVAVDIWNCNATGTYSGIATEGNYATGGYNSTYLRGIQLTDGDGVVSFETIFPGHYGGRAVHTHLLSHNNAQVMPNGTISVWNSPVSHIGQLFWPEDLRAEVEATYPYNTNTVALTTNDEDMWSILSADASFDPIPQWVYLGDDISDGLFAWIQIGINGSADYTEDEYYGVAAYLDAEGGHSTGYTIGGGGNGTGNGTTPSGTPSGSLSSALPSSSSA
ncbi:aromatic compound dioxygenase [Annulohypoxylon maeteangense]|uniref:aromatic compound dioxygenase n=1 Tax=Annulohypoxylon maeteangense TaxID=1927788 RepID=UPI002007D29B|nr:aromatic compound dioxygenase [Annulohypoxylon maeteangense]KAI0888663.1 aromatic compound dioxygenase [Annulohypoxylon maeteangense]